jgi:hypothetical protein
LRVFEISSSEKEVLAWVVIPATYMNFDLCLF